MGRDDITYVNTPPRYMQNGPNRGAIWREMNEKNYKIYINCSTSYSNLTN